MTQNISPHPWTRRNFLKNAVALAAAPSVLAAQATPTRSKNGKIFVYAGAYTSAVDGGANGEGIYLFEMDPHTGELSAARLVAKRPTPRGSSFILHGNIFTLSTK